MADFDLVIRGPRVITKAGEVPRCIAVRDGVVVAIEPMEAELEGQQTVELADDEVLLPGLVDTHVHVNEPGRTEWEGFATATRAAAAGGVTTLIDMPLNSIPPTCTVEALEIKTRGRARASATSTSASGAAPSPATSTTCAGCTTPGCSASSASWPTRASTSSRRWPRRSSRSTSACCARTGRR